MPMYYAMAADDAERVVREQIDPARPAVEAANELRALWLLLEHGGWSPGEIAIVAQASDGHMTHIPQPYEMED